MRQSQLFIKTRKEAPKGEVSRNAELLIRGGFISKQMAGVYAYLPLGLIVLEKINSILRQEMNKIGGQEMLMSALQEKGLWEQTDRWNDLKNDAWFKTKLKNGTEVGLGMTHEEPITKTLSDFISSYKQLPLYLYQIQLKFRNETRAKSGIMRTREFLMKDLYSFSRTIKEHETFYEKAKNAYFNIFERVGLKENTFLTYASGGIFSEFSHEFQTISGAGEDTIYIHKEKNIAINKEVLRDDVLKKLGCKKDDLKEAKSIEVGNIFTLGTRFSEPLSLTYKNELGKDIPVIMGSYGIGPGRVMGTIAETHSDDYGIIWPKEVTPFHIHLVTLRNDQEIIDRGEQIYKKAVKKGITVLWDDRDVSDVSAGEKLNESDLLGIHIRINVGKKTKEKECEMVMRETGNKKIVTIENALRYINDYYA